MRLIEYEMEYFENQRKQEQLEQERIQKGILNPDEVEKALYIIDMNSI